MQTNDTKRHTNEIECTHAQQLHVELQRNLEEKKNMVRGRNKRTAWIINALVSFPDQAYMYSFT